MAHVIVDCNVIIMGRLNGFHFKAQLVRLFKENYSYSLIAKKLGHSKAWAGKLARDWKTNQVESLQS